MPWRRICAIVLMVTIVLPITLLLCFLAFVGLPFWLAGVFGWLIGSYDLGDVLTSGYFEAVLLFISAPMGIIGLFTLWFALFQIISNDEIRNHKWLMTGLVFGILASANLAWIGWLLPLALFPAVILVFVHIYLLYKKDNAVQTL